MPLRGGYIAYNAVILGGGPGGYVCALRIVQLGGKAIVVEESSLGGTCSNSGCIPVKAMHSSAKIIRDIRMARRHGIKVQEPEIDYIELRKRALNVAKISVMGIQHLLKNAGIDIKPGHGKITSPGSVEVNGETLHADNIVIATGSRPVEIPGAPFGGKVLSSDTLLDMDSIPRSLLIVGGGYIGVEYASIFNTLGTKVSIVEMMPCILPGIDPEIVQILQRSLIRDGIEIKLKTKVDGVSTNGAIVGGVELPVEKILVSVGRKPNFDHKELESLGIKYDRGISVDTKMSTSASGIYAVGDVVGRMMLAHVATTEGHVAAENIMGHRSDMEYSAIPSCVFTFPEIAVVGSMDAGQKTGKFPFIASGKARALGETEGLVKVYVKDGVITGTAVIGPHASDLIGEACIAIRNKIKISDITATIHPHPVLSEAFHEACLDTTGEALHK